MLELISSFAATRTALILCEMQRGIMGDLAISAPLKEACINEGITANCALLARAARVAGVRVVHSWLVMRPDLAGTTFNTPLMRGARKRGALLFDGSERADPVPELTPQATDIVSTHSYGVTPFASRDLDQILRNLGIQVLVAAGVSLNEGITGLCIVGADLGYEVILPVDACTGTPAEYKQAMLRNTFNLLTTQTTTADLLKVWSASTHTTADKSR